MTRSYPSVHFDPGNSGHVPDRGDMGRSREVFETIWSTAVDGELRATPVVGDELVVVGDTNGTVNALDAIDGRVRWKTDLDAPRIHAAAAVADGTVFVSGLDDLNRTEETTYALDLTTGDVRWARAFGQGGKTAVATDGERAYVVTDDGACHALAADTGETVWQAEGERWAETPAIADGTVLLDAGERVVARDAERGTERWRADLNGRVRTPPVVDDGRAVVVAGSTTLWSLDVATGRTRWRADVGAAIRDHPETGDPLLPLGGGVLTGKPVTGGETLVVGMYEGLVELDAADGRLLDYHPLGQRIHDPLLVGAESEERLVAHVRNEGLTEFRRAADATAVRSAAADALNTVPAYAAGVFYVVTPIGDVRALV